MRRLSRITRPCFALLAMPVRRTVCAASAEPMGEVRHPAGIVDALAVQNFRADKWGGHESPHQTGISGRRSRAVRI